MLTMPRARKAQPLTDITPAVFHDVKKNTYLKQLKQLQEKMLDVQQAYYRQDKKAIIVFEGWDAGGKGGSIRRLTEKLDPRGYNVHSIAAPSPDELARHYLYRFQTKLPRNGTISIFDRSWYGRVLVERVEGFASQVQWKRAYTEINQFEQMQIDDETHVVKLFMHISKEEQLRRFEERLSNPKKRWKLTEEDIRNRQQWNAYEDAIAEMFKQTSTADAPWYVIPGDHKWYARLAVLNTVITQLAINVNLTPPPVDPEVAKLARQAFCRT